METHTFRLIDRGITDKVEIRQSNGPDRITIPCRPGELSNDERRKIRSMGLDVRATAKQMRDLAASWDALTPRMRIRRAIDEARRFLRWAEARHREAILACADAIRDPEPEKRTHWTQQLSHLEAELANWSDVEDRASNAYHQLVNVGWFILDYMEMDRFLEELRNADDDECWTGTDAV